MEDLRYEPQYFALTPQLPRLLKLVSPEVVVVGDSGDAPFPSGAAGVAVSLAGLGAQVELLSVCADDFRGALLRRQLIGYGVGTSGLASTAPAVASALADKTANADCVLLADHGRGVADHVRKLITKRRADLPLYVAGDGRAWRQARPDLVIARQAGGAHTNLVLLDDGGSILVSEHQLPYRTWPATTSWRRAAASDSAIATLVLGMVADLPPLTSAELAQTAADITAGLPDPLVCTTCGLAARLANYQAVPLPALERVVDRHRRRGRRIVVTSGDFDLVNRAVLDRLNQARRLGEVHVVAVPNQHGVAAVAALSCVDHVTITDDETQLVNRLRPDTYLC